MRKNIWKKIAIAGVSAVMAAACLTGCSALGSAPTVAAETTGAEKTEAASSDSAAEAESTTAQASDGGTRLDDILARGYIEVCTEPYFAPNEFIDPSKQGDEQYVGSDIEMAKYIADKLGVELRIVPLEFDAVLTGITDGKYDLAISALAYTPARAEAMELSKGYRFENEATQYGLAVRASDIDKIKGVEDLADKVVVCQSGSLQEMFVTQQVPAMKEMKRVSSSNDAMLAVAEKKADAAAMSLTTAQLYIDANPAAEMAIVPDFYFTVDESTSGTRIGITKGETKLCDRINEIIDELVESGQYDAWYEEAKDYARSLGIE